mmetsp:Transcript_46532/g.104608  ORF Transcript_46532/g.104608 Transcript_46532/m.104608 type:complete len:269 (-) Transcript_46532:392-1198(-)
MPMSSAFVVEVCSIGPGAIFLEKDQPRPRAARRRPGRRLRVHRLHGVHGNVWEAEETLQHWMLQVSNSCEGIHFSLDPVGLCLRGLPGLGPLLGARGQSVQRLCAGQPLRPRLLRRLLRRRAQVVGEGLEEAFRESLRIDVPVCTQDVVFAQELGLRLEHKWPHQLRRRASPRSALPRLLGRFHHLCVLGLGLRSAFARLILQLRGSHRLVAGAWGGGVLEEAVEVRTLTYPKLPLDLQGEGAPNPVADGVSGVVRVEGDEACLLHLH